MSNKNVWKTNWNASPNKNDELDPTNNYRSIRSTGNRYSRYAPNHNDKNSTQSILQRAKLPKTHHTHDKNNGYGQNTYNQGLPFHTVLQQQPKCIQSIHDDDDKDLVYLSNMTLDHEHATRPPPLPSDTQSNKRFPQNSPQTSADKKAANTPLSSTGKWRSRRAEKLKKNPHQKHPYSSKPIPSSREHTEAANIELSAVSPTTYKDSRFTRFAQEQLHNHSSHTNNSSIGTATRKKSSVDKKHIQNDIVNANVAAHEGEQWFYKDPSGQEQGPFVKSQMSQWFNDGYFPQDLPIRCNPATPFVQLKDWFLQGMTAFLEEIPTQWPQTNEQVIINPNVCGTDRDSNMKISPPLNTHVASGNVQDMDIESEVAINKTSYTQYPHTTPPSSDNDDFTTPVKALFDDVENTTNKSSTVAGDDSFYDPNSTRMVSIHPRPNIHEQGEMNISMNMNITNDMNDDKINMNQDEALDYYLDNKNEDATNEYDYNKYNKYDYDTNQVYLKEQYVEVNDNTPPPTIHALHSAHSYHHHPTTTTNKLTPVSAYDRSLAATPPAQKPSKTQHQASYASYHRTEAMNEIRDDETHNTHEYEEEYNYTPSTNPEHNEEADTINLPLFRSNTDPTDYHHINTNDIDMIQQSTSDPKDSGINRDNNHTNLYDPFGGQDLFANGRRNLTQHQHHVQMTHAHSYNMAQAQRVHEKYADATREPMKRIQNESIMEDENGTSASSLSTTPNAKQPRDRKPPIRHKWPHHFMATTQMQFEQMMVKQPMNVDAPSNKATPPNNNNVNNNNVQNARYSPPNPKITATQSHDSQLQQSSERSTKKRKRRKKKHSNKMSNKTNANNHTPNAWGANKTKRKPSFMEIQAADEHEQQQIKRKQREDIKRRQDVIKQQKQQQLLRKQVKQQEQKMYNDTANSGNPWQTNAVTKSKNVANNNNASNKSSPKSKKKKVVNKDGGTNSISATWSSRAKGIGSSAAATQLINPNNNRRNNNNANNNNKSRKNKQNANKAAKSNRNVNNNNANNNNNNHKQQQQQQQLMQQGNNRNIEAVNKVSAELQTWLRTEIKKLNADVEAASVAHLLLTLDDDTAKTTAYHTFGSGKEVNTFIDSFLVHRNHDMQQQRNKTTSQKVNHSQQKKKKGKKTRR